MEENNNNEEKKTYEIVSGDGSTLDISPAYDNLEIESEKLNEKPTNIVIPQSIKSKKKDEDDKDSDEKSENKD